MGRARRKGNMEGYICQNCGEDWAEASLLPISDLYNDRIQPGEIMPDGECPECGGVCFAKETPEEIAAERVRRHAPELLAALERMLEAQICGDNCAVCEDARAAIARAVGEVEESELERARR